MLLFGSARRCVHGWSHVAKQLGKYGVDEVAISKLRLLQENTAIRCGVLMNTCQGSFGSAFVTDKEALGSSWVPTLINRWVNEDKTPVLMKYGDQFREINGEVRTFEIPSSFLKETNAEILEIPEQDQSKDKRLPHVHDGCHVYLDIRGDPTVSQPTWPTIEIEDVLSKGKLLLTNQIDSQMALESLLKYNNSTISEYLNKQNASNFDRIRAKLVDKLKDGNLIRTELKSSIRRYLQSTDRDFSNEKRLIGKRDLTNEEIDKWAECSHKTLRDEIVPSFLSFARAHLSLWKLYTYSPAKLKLNFMEYCMIPLYKVHEIENSAKVLEANMFREFDLETVNAQVMTPILPTTEIQKIGRIQTEINKAIYKQFFTIQLPMVLCALLGVVSEQFSAYYMGSLAALGIVLGFWRCMKQWQYILNGYTRKVSFLLKDRIELRRAELKKLSDRCFEEKALAAKKKKELLEPLLEVDLRQKNKKC
ncbi:hypothetical protein AO441_003329 [Nakaseomyces glabratus]|uniref:Mmc1 C-terminal domain-containing protein n=1 Tax=Candida glabrata TaxID=5478 RepID=A0A0W0DCG5_CANGB|nr:hypothetical protein AO440_003391 [Nakaseomyces glabratus]KTA99916.1 hypothetical protein AO439_003460 [Nakaseomyces glabratus]KTB09516.1 hypothetical protein AO441_003329 [Nakaseomyces glabratus]KTB11970.1 hypothetical protein AO438_003485 [Nakaseomyces glabratus]